VDATSVYWTEWNGGTVKKVDLAGLTSPVTLATGFTTPAAVVVNASAVYFIDGSGIYKVGLDGGTITTLVSGSGGGYLALDATHVYWTTLGSGAGAGTVCMAAN
jgi:hypothetical protein